MRRSCKIAAAIICLIPAVAHAADFTGKFTDTKLSVELSPAADKKYTGLIVLNGKNFPVTATADGNKLAGSFNAGGSDFAFSATLDGDRLTLMSGGQIYTLDRPSTVKNPLAADAGPTNPLAIKETATTGATVLATTDSGQAIFFAEPSTDSASAALQAVVPELAKLLGDRPKISTAFADSKQATRGLAQFTATVKGRPVQGVILCGGGEKGEVVSVLYAGEKASPAEWAVLQAALPRQERMSTYSFPDGTGSIDLPDGWECKSTSVDGGVLIKGPKDQLLGIGRGIGIQTTDSPLMRLYHQNQATARRMGLPAPPKMAGILVCDFASPADALKILVPQFSEASQANGFPSIHLDEIVEAKDVKPNTTGGKAQQLTFLWTKGQDRTEVKMKAVSQSESMQVGNGAWVLYFTEMDAAKATFDSDAVTMYAIIQSLKVDMPTLQRVQQEKLQAMSEQFRDNQKRSFEQQQKAHQEQIAGYDRYNQAWKDRELVKSRSAADFNELIIGYRTVQDTQTGEKASADLGNVDGIVNKLNENDPGRYKQIPLRDELYPK